MCCVVLQGWCFYFTKRQTNEMCAIFILYFVLFLFVTCFGWNFSAIVVVVVVVVVSVVVVLVLVSVVVVLVMSAAAVAASAGWWLREGGREEYVSLGVIITNTEIKFHILLFTLH